MSNVVQVVVTTPSAATPVSLPAASPASIRRASRTGGSDGTERVTASGLSLHPESVVACSTRARHAVRGRRPQLPAANPNRTTRLWC